MLPIDFIKPLFCAEAELIFNVIVGLQLAPIIAAFSQQSALATSDSTLHILHISYGYSSKSDT
ncbi:MAG: hypothetical protein H6Q17_883 [Bacteroidetes bacterium]|nr:hypothetical protein [Bacteroidota bacterium]